MKSLAFIILVSTRLTYISTSDSPPANGCLLWDSQCMTMYAQSAAPSVIQYISENFVKMDPLAIELIEIHELGLVLDKTDNKMYGLKNMFVDHLSFDTEANMTHFIFHTDIYSTGHYKSSGSIFNSPVFGDSDYRIILNNVEIEMMLQYSIGQNAKGEDIAEITSNVFRFDVRDGATYFYEKLYNGDTKSSDAMHFLWNKNWKLVANLYGNKFIGGIVDGIINAVSQCLLKTPVSELGKF